MKIHYSQRIYNIYNGMKGRTGNRSNPKYRLYGARGIKCLWISFEDFKNDMYESYKLHIKIFGERNTSIDRIDNNGNYCKENCRWSTYKEQANNRRNNKFYYFRGKKLNLTDWSKELGVSVGTLYTRIKFGWNIDDVLSTPPQKNGWKQKRLNRFSIY
jgi:hypothetical protein